MKNVFSFVLFLFAILVFVSKGEATVLSVNVEKLAQADVAFTGTCVDAKTHLIFPAKAPEGILVTSYTFEVAKEGVIKGAVSEEFKFTQWGTTKEESLKYATPFVVDLPLYEVGKEYTLFLTSETELGLRAPIGLGYGKFNMIHEPSGEVKVMNDFGNKGLFVDVSKNKSMTKAMTSAGFSTSKPPSGPIDYDQFVNVVKGVSKGE